MFSFYSFFDTVEPNVLGIAEGGIVILSCYTQKEKV